MLLKYFYDSYLAQASYLVGCSQRGEALIIDPARDVTPYLEAAAAEGLRITQVTETHIHADFVSGARELVAAGARLYLSDMGDENWKYAFADADTVLLRDGDSWMVGNIRVEVLHTPGHTPEHLCFQITDTAGADRPMGIFTGDCLFVGNVGRPDLLETAAGFSGTKESGGRDQFASVQRFKSLPDYLQIWPGHGAGSACGKGLGAVPSSTLGYEKLFNPAFQVDDESAFVRWLLDGQPDVPRYFAEMKRVNKAGPPLLETLSPPAQLPPEKLASLAGEAFVIDTRSNRQFTEKHVPGTLNIPLSERQFSTWAGWFVDYSRPTYLLVDEAALPDALERLRAIGIDNIPGYFTPDALANADGKIEQVKPERAAELLENGEFNLLDVRGEDEYAEQHIPGALHIPLGQVLYHLPELETAQPLIVQCGGGVRSQLVISLLQARGFNNLLNLTGGIERWEKAGLPVETNNGS